MFYYSLILVFYFLILLILGRFLITANHINISILIWVGNKFLIRVRSLGVTLLERAPSTAQEI
jgi:hypothetical protein